MTRKWIYSSIVALVLSYSSSSIATSNTIKIGIAGPHSGANAAFGEQLWRGAELAAKDINEKGGINGKQIELIKADDACEPKQAVTIANRLVEFEHVDAVVGHFCSSSTIPASEVYADADVLMITPASTNPSVTDRGLETIFRTCGRDDQQGLVAADFIHNTLKAKNIAVIHDKDTYGQGLADATRGRLETLGHKIALYEGLTRGEKDFNALVTKLKQVKADAIYFGGMHPEAGPLVRQLREQGSEIPFISGDGIMSQDFVTSAGGARMVRHVYMTFGRDPRKLSEGQKVVTELRTQGFEPEGYTLYAYATVEIIADAIKATQASKGDHLAKWLHANTVDTVMGPKKWNNQGDLKETDYVMYAWKTDGSYSEVSGQ
ncbi:MAG: branched-chain amino acid ABC transporter substrate-binding protein [Gammaproteobacteria bacterium]